MNSSEEILKADMKSKRAPTSGMKHDRVI